MGHDAWAVEIHNPVVLTFKEFFSVYTPAGNVQFYNINGNLTKRYKHSPSTIGPGSIPGFRPVHTVHNILSLTRQ